MENFYVIMFSFNIGRIYRLLRFFDDPMPEEEVFRMNALRIAYIGDAVWELIVRDHLIVKGLNVHHMHAECIRLVNAGAQSSFIQLLLPELTEAEAEIVKRGRNAHARHPAPKNQHPEDYSMSTGFEVLIGFLYLTGNKTRLDMFSGKILGGTNDG